MTPTTFKKGIAVCCFLFGVILFIGGGYYLWTTPIEHGWGALMALAVGVLLHVIFYVLWQ